MPTPSSTPSSKPANRRLPPRAECELCGTLVLDGKRLPMGPCWVREARKRALLGWTNADGATQVREISKDLLSQLLAEGLLQRVAGFSDWRGGRRPSSG